jgi:hypothetical protein
VVYIIVLCRQCDFRLFLIRPCAPPPYASCVHGSCLRGSAPIIDTDNSGIAQQTRYSLSHVNLNCAHYGASLDIDNISFINMDELELAIPCVPITNLIGSNACTIQWFPSNARRAERTYCHHPSSRLVCCRFTAITAERPCWRGTRLPASSPELMPAAASCAPTGQGTKSTGIERTNIRAPSPLKKTAEPSMQLLCAMPWSRHHNLHHRRTR